MEPQFEKYRIKINPLDIDVMLSQKWTLEVENNHQKCLKSQKIMEKCK